MLPRRRPCEFHRRGGCDKGSQCDSLHTGPPGSVSDNGAPSDQNAKGASHQPSRGLPRSATRNAPSMDLCRNFAESGQCKFGDGCRYRHESQVDGNTTKRHRQPVGSISNSRGPPGVCREYYETGKCARSFECRYKHVPGNQQVAPNIQVEGSSSSKEVGSLRPNEIHNTLKRFNWPDFKFKSTLDMCVFAAALSSAKEENGYELSDANTLLNMVGDPGQKYFVLVDAILRYDPVSTAAGRSKTELSFQRGYIPILSYLSSEYVIRSTLHQSVNALYGLIETNFDRLVFVLETCFERLMGNKSFCEVERELGGLDVFKCVTICLTEYAERYKRAVPSHPTFAPLVRKLSDWFTQWSIAISTIPPGFQDPICTMKVDERRFRISRLEKLVMSLLELVDQAEGFTNRIRERGKSAKSADAHKAALLSALELNYEGPGQQRRQGPRHDNDFEDIADIRIAPTHDELCCILPPYLPANVPGGPHHLPANSMAKLVDIQFRLLREELIAPIRTSLGHVVEALRNPAHPTSLTKLLAGEGGLYKSPNDGTESAVFSVYTGVEFKKLGCDIRSGLSNEILFNAPAGRARQANASARAAYWESVGRKRLMEGGLVALVWKTNRLEDDIKIYLGVVTSFTDDLVQSSKKSVDRVALRVSFFEPEAHMRILASLQRGGAAAQGQRYLVEAPIMFESIRPFLETLKHVNPSSIPFARYLAHPENGTLKGIDLQLPTYASIPDYSMDLSSLFNQPTDLTLNPSDQGSVERARVTLKAESRLDPSQADAVLDTLVSEVSMIQGPPGTGKSFCGTEILQVLVANKVRPILLIAFTNHALDNILVQVLEKKITDKIVRLGSRSKHEIIEKYGLKELMTIGGESGMAKAASAERWKLRDIQKEIDKLVDKIVKRDVPINDMDSHLARQYPNHADELDNPPFWTAKLFEDSLGWENADGRPIATTLLQFWQEGGDLAFITPPAPPSEELGNQRKTGRGKGKGKGKGKSDELSDNRFADLDESPRESGQSVPELQMDLWRERALLFFDELGFADIPEVPLTARSISEGLLEDWEVWKMSLSERRCLYDFWVNEVREMSYEKDTTAFELLRNRHSEARAKFEGLENETKLEILKKRDIIGCTTNGAARLIVLLKCLAPKVLLVEEAGQVLEAHILASLVPSIEQLILIGDPLQLRPTLANFNLSMENKRTGHIYRFDQSLMERLSEMGLRMSRLDVQRRMRPTISHLIRSTLYPHLEDHSLVEDYPHVLMIKDLVMHLLRQGAYAHSGDIVVLCAYLGQLQKIRLALAKEVTTVIDDRDAAQLIDHEEQEDQAAAAADLMPKGSVEQVHVSKRVLLRTVDNFQGEEGTIVILSLVRNSGLAQTARKGGIGFLKSNNRANVALSRARHGLYILGNADDLSSRSGMHRDTVKMIDRPGQLAFYAPDVCGEPCESQICPDCGPAAAKEQVVDMIGGAKLSEMDPHGEELDNMVITLSCKHIFTVETLDGICELQKYYSQDHNDGRWVDLAPPPEGLQQAPTCPLCRGPINSLRYGRVFKRADLDLSEQNVANSARRSIQDVVRRVERFDVGRSIVKLKISLGRMKYPDAAEKQNAKKVKTPRFQPPALNTASLLPVDVESFGDQAGSHFPLPTEAVAAWKNVVQILLSAYQQVVRVAENRPTHVQAYEAAITTLHHRYLTEFERHPELLKEGIKPHEEALKQAKRRCGLPAPPRADMRFRVEAFWVTIQIRFLMVQTAQDGIDSVRDRSKGFMMVRDAWMDFIGFLITSIEHDARTAIQLSHASQSHRQVVKTTLLLMEAQYAIAQHDAARRGNGASGQILEELKSRAHSGSTLAKQTIAETSRAYRHAMSGRQEDQEWVDEHFVQPGNGIVDKWESLGERLSRGVSNQEKRDILKAFMTGYRGMPGFRGNSHTLDRSNTAAAEFEALAQEQGLPANPWGFGG
ncbi:hypothetical protein FRB98_007249 [Tulasnella sp. 332]|nr:hypothetical protein FRB98_007249 [Tulasnella sp. 332]